MMKQKIIFFMIILLVPPVYSRFLSAADISIGATSWYASWDFKSENENDTDSKMGPELMYGPLISVKFDKDWSLSSVFLYSSKYEMVNASSTDVTEISRMDSDTLLNYGINRYVKAFAGVKFMQFVFDDGYHRSAGPGAGVGISLPVTDSLFVLLNGSVSYLFGEHKDPDLKWKMTEYGFNTNASLAYYFESISTTLNLGYRLQLFRTDPNDSSRGELTHTFYGFTASAVYSF